MSLDNCAIVDPRGNPLGNRCTIGPSQQAASICSFRPSPAHRMANRFSPDSVHKKLTQKPLLLASASPIRRQLLENSGITVEVIPVRIDEAAIRQTLEAEGATPRDVADALAEFKARRAADRMPGRLVLGCDQVLELKGQVFAKPDDREEAADHLGQLAGQTHRLLSAAVIYEDGAPVWRHVGQARLTMHALKAQEIEAYLQQAWPDVAGCVGAYQAEALGARLFSRIDGDWFSVLGLPLLEILSYLRLRGWPER